MPLNHMCLAVLPVMIWALNLVLQKMALVDLSPYVFMSLRFLISVPLLFFVPRPDCSLKTIFVLTLFISVFHFLFLAIGLKMGAGAGETALIFQTASFLSVFFSCILCAYLPQINQVVGMVISFFGVYLIASTHMLDGLSMGLVMIFIGAVSLGLGMAIMQKVHVTPSLSLIVWMNSMGAIPMILITLCVQGPFAFMGHVAEISWSGIGTLLYAGLVASIGANYIWFKMIKLYGNAPLSIFLFLHPLFACVIAYCFLGETLSMLDVMGGAIIFLGILVNQFWGRMKLKTQPA